MSITWQLDDAVCSLALKTSQEPSTLLRLWNKLVTDLDYKVILEMFILVQVLTYTVTITTHLYQHEDRVYVQFTHIPVFPFPTTLFRIFIMQVVAAPTWF